MATDLSRRDFDPGTVELMDVVTGVDAVLLADLRNLRELNRWFGSYRIIRHYLTRWVPPGSSQHFLDLCTGSGDIPRLIVDWCRARKVDVRIEALDFQEATLDVARSLSQDYPEIVYGIKDATRLDARQTYTGVFCSLALHHFSQSDAIAILAAMRRTSHGFVLAADLERSRFTWLGVRLITSTVFREPMTVHDALLSVRRAFSFAEFSQLAREAGWPSPEHRRFLYGRQVLALPSAAKITASS